MFSGVMALARPALLALDPERAHEITLRSLERGFYPRLRQAPPKTLSQTIWDMPFPNPFGIAAGFDKDARVPDAILAMGFGFAEIGTITPLAQIGNPRPRVFRLIRDRAVINRLGFNNGGHGAALSRLEKRRGRGGIVGINIGANKNAVDRIADYVAGLRCFHHVAGYFTINISSPNTPGLRDLQAPRELDALLTQLMAVRAEIVAGGGGHRPPIIVKLAPDVVDEDLPEIVAMLLAHKVDGICVSNTTLARPELLDANTAQQAGGLSGRPLFERSTRMLARVYRLSEGRVPLIGVGGVTSGETAVAKIEAGASLVQVYTGLIYEGPGLISQMSHAVYEAVECSSANGVAGLVGRKADEWADKLQ